MVKHEAVVEQWRERFRRFLVSRRYSRFAVKSYLGVGRTFLLFLASRRIDPAAARPSDVEAFLNARRAARRRQGREPADAGSWRSHYTSPIHQLLRMAQQQWPPPTAASRQVASYRLSLQHRHRSRHTVTAYEIVAQRFLAFVEQRGVRLEQVQQTDVAAFLKHELGRYRRRHGREPKDPINWRCSLTSAIHDLLRRVQGQWPPPPTDPWVERFRTHMEERCHRPATRGHYLHVAGEFLAHLQRVPLPLEQAGLAEVEAYCRLKLTAYRARHHRPPGDLRLWRRSLSIPIHRLLRLAHGTWPPPAPIDPLLERFRAEITAGRYGRWRHGEMDRAARQFLGFIHDHGVTPEQVQPALVESFLRARLERYRRRHGHEPPDSLHWRRRAMAPLRRLLGLAQGDWPPPQPPPSGPREHLRAELREGFRHWMTEVRGLSPLSFTKDWHNATRLLEWLGEEATVEALRQLSPADLDAFLAWRMAGLRRATRCGVCSGLRSFLRYLRASGLIERDLASCVGNPSRYWNEGIPSAFTEPQVKAMLEAARSDRGTAGRRDYAILLFLATYGLRAGEITRLRLSDIDWRRERFRITQSKSGRSSHLPLTREVGDAIIDYLRHGRPQSVHREVFLRAIAPYPPFARGSSLTALVGRRMRRAGVVASGKHGAHAFRYARAVGLLRAAVPLKTISDLLGHSTSASTETYLKLDTDELRGIALEVPQEEAP